MTFLRSLRNKVKPTIRFVDALVGDNKEQIEIALVALSTASPATIVADLNQLGELHPNLLERAYFSLVDLPFETLRPLFLAEGSRSAGDPLPPLAKEFSGLQNPVRVSLLQLLGKIASRRLNPNEYACIVSDSDCAVRRTAMQVMGHCFRQILTDPRLTDLDWVRSATKEMAEKRMPLFLRGLSDTDPFVRHHALRGLAETREQMPIAEIVPLLGDPVAHVRMNAVSALARNKATEEVTQDLCERIRGLSTDPDKFVRQAVVHFYSMTTIYFPDLVRRYTDTLVTLSGDEDPDVRKKALELLDKVTQKR